MVHSKNLLTEFDCGRFCMAVNGRLETVTAQNKLLADYVIKRLCSCIL